MVKPCSRASRFSNEAPSEAEVAEQAARQRDLERTLEDHIERQRGADRSDACEDERASLVPGERSKHIGCRGEIHPNQRNDADINGSRDKEYAQPLPLPKLETTTAAPNAPVRRAVAVSRLRREIIMANSSWRPANPRRRQSCGCARCPR